ncbi:MAG: ATP-binding protein [bacterium]
MKTDSFKHIRRVILSRVLLVPFIIVMLVFGTLLYYFASNLRDQVASQLVRIADGHRNLIEQFLQERAYDLKFAAASHSFKGIGYENKLALILEQLQTGSPAFFDLGVFDERADHIAYVGPYNLKGKNYADSEWFKAVQKKNIYISDVFSGYRKIPHFIIAVKKEEGDRVWYLRATIDTLFFNDLVENIRVGKTGEAYLLNRDGMFQTRRRSGGNLMETDPDYGTYRARGKETISFVAESNLGGMYLYAAGRLRGTGWLLVVRQEIGDAYAPLARAVVLAVAIVIMGGAVVVMMAFVLATGVAGKLTAADIEKRQMGAQLLMAGRLAEVGEMSAGLAHEINNPLQIMKSEQFMINDILNEIEKDGRQPDPENLRLVRDSVNQIGTQIDRCRQVTQGLLKFARKSETSIKSVRLEPLILEVVEMVERRARVEDIRIVKKFDTLLPPIFTDPAQLQQVFLNLLNNAIYALKGKNNGEIQIAADRENDEIAVSVSDNGCGIREEHLEKIFLPFFTTKPVGTGTGLGLSTCYGIIERLGGTIAVASEVNVGTVFTVRMPLDGPGAKGKSESKYSDKEGEGQ